MKVLLSEIVYDMEVDGVTYEDNSLPTEVIVEIDDADPEDPYTEEEIREFALDAHARDNDWLIADCKMKVL